MRGAAGRGPPLCRRRNSAAIMARFRDYSLTNRCLWVMRSTHYRRLAMHIGRSRTLIRLFLSAALAAAGAGNLRAQARAEVLAKPATSIVAAAVRDRSRRRDSRSFASPCPSRSRPTPSLMESPDRVIVDLPEVAFHLAAENGKKREGVIASYRYGLFAPGPVPGRHRPRPARRRGRHPGRDR